MAGNELHGVIVDAALAADGEDRHDIGVVQPSDGLGLAAEALHGFVIGSHTESQDLQGNAATEGSLLGLIDHAHAASTELAEDAELTQGGRLLGGWPCGAMDELDAGQAGFELRGQLGMSGQQLVAVGSPAGLELGHVTVQDAGNRRGRAGRRNRLLLMRVGAIRLVDRGVVGLGHLRRSSAASVPGKAP